MLPSGCPAPAAFCMTVFQEMGDLVSVLGMDRHGKGVAAFRCLFDRPAFLIPSRPFRGIRLYILFRGNIYNITFVDNMQYKNKTLKIRAALAKR